MAGANTYGTTWLKALYRGYTDETFSEYSEQPPWEGTQGPIIRAEVGDMIEIMFVNKMKKNYATMHSMGLAYTKLSEGADYPNTTTPGASNSLDQSNAVPPVMPGVEPNGCVVYKWIANNAAGPDANEPARTHSYHSYVDLAQDTNAGLVGPTIIYGNGQMSKTMAEYREITLLYLIYNEGNSFLSGENAAALGSKSSSSGSSAYGSASYNGQGAGFNGGQGGGYSGGQGGGHSRRQGGGYSGGQGGSYGGQGQSSSGSIDTSGFPAGNHSIWYPQIVNLESAGQFQQAPAFFTLNGYIFANNPIFEMCLNDKVIWYVNAYGAASHVFHMHGNGVAYRGANDQAISLNDGVGKTLVMQAYGQGLWQVICHVDNHHELGMVANYNVYPAGQCPLPALSSS
jgi:FtsP/CotA-like multicopper oxidase with cupredoxin domain